MVDVSCKDVRTESCSAAIGTKHKDGQTGVTFELAMSRLYVCRSALMRIYVIDSWRTPMTYDISSPAVPLGGLAPAHPIIYIVGEGGKGVRT